MSHAISDKDQIVSYFKYPCEVFPTRGTREGLILKFATFYLKVYDDDKENSYVIEGYRYGCDAPVFIDTVAENRIREYADRF